ncbi:tetratricopeptide repeat protein [uncultured Ralstonia sp.]|jgi:hypothetical protein|uniref:tetratricopeptide repeat protein n=1 Tax=Ralstonia sp. TaxID=54061 RepID=UPI001EA81424|nr:tetratricopeptide repeat protein [uncultured Ralstonia sp.]UCF23062.1 MAG: tetratricopeptide repeat protein [Ralstonia sp.]
MPFLGIGFHVIVALFFAVHVVRNNQNMYWLFILFAFPLLGSVVYFFAIYLPEMRHSHGARVATRAVTQLIDPNRAVREARNDFDRAPTVQHRVHLGEALLDAGNAKEAREHFEQAATGPFAGDAAVLLGLARAQFATGDAALAKTSLDKLFEAHRAARQQPDPTLLYTQALAATGAANTRDAFEHALTCANDAAARCLFGEWLLTQNNDADRQRAQALFDDILRDAKHWTRYAKDHNREWLQRAQAAQSSSR